jgi:sigma-B regulation protein RsbU (phosphoserine phosphatase)
MLERVSSQSLATTIGGVTFMDSEDGAIVRSLSAWALPSADGDSSGLVISIGDLAPETSGEFVTQKIAEELREINGRLLVSGVRQIELAASAVNSERKLRELIHSVNAIVYELDGTSGRFTFVSERAQEFLGYSMEAWNEPDFWKRVIVPDYYKAAMQGFEVARRKGIDHQHEFPVISADGSVIWVRNIARVVRDAQGSISKVRTVIIDDTAQQHERETRAKAFDRERAIAEALQYFVLSEAPECSFPGLSVATIYEAALDESRVGGDFFDAFGLKDGKVMLVVGDVTGKGLKAAARTVEVKYSLRAFAHGNPMPEDALAQLNDYICGHHAMNAEEDGRFIAIAVAVVDCASGLTHFVSAGAERPFVARVTGLVEEATTSGLMLGIQSGATYSQFNLVIEVGDVIVLTTDGITEARRGSDFFGWERIADIIKQADPEMPLQDLGRLVVDAARSHGDGSFSDDVCILLARRHRIE